MDIKNELEKMNIRFSPTQSQEERVFAEIMNRLDEKATRKVSYTNFIRLITMRNLFKNKALATSVFAAIFTVMFVLPTGILLLKNESNLQIAPAEAPEEETLLGQIDEEEVDLRGYDQQTEDDAVDYEPLNTFESNEVLDDGEIDYAPGAEVTKEISPSISNSEDTSTPEEERIKEQTATIGLYSEDIKSDFNKIKNFASDNGGYLSSSRLYNVANGTKAVIEMRIPSGKFQDVLNSIYDMDLEVLSESIETIDKQNELTENLETKTTLEETIANLESEIKKETDATKKAELESQLETTKYMLESTTSNIETLQQETNYSSIKVNLEQIDSDSQFELSEIPETFVTVLSFWIQVAIVCSVPVIVIIVIVLAVRKFKKKK